MEFFPLLLQTVLLRPYVFVFLAIFLFAATIAMGLRRTLVFLFSTWVLAFLSEFSSTRNGFPYGLYHYTGFTLGRELYISNVPFMDSLSYSFLLFASFSMALFFSSPLRIAGKDAQPADTFPIRQSRRVLLLTALFMMMIDFIIDPAALRGERWFLGKIYFYDYEGAYFGVPLTNALGWGLVGFVAMYVYQRIERKWLGAGVKDVGLCLFRWSGLLGVGLYYGVLLFNLAVTAWIGETGLLIAGIFVYLLPTAFLILRFSDRKARATEEEWNSHLKDFQLPPEQIG
jgi:uncharacterized membrane protein